MANDVILYRTDDGELDETVVVNYQLTTTRHGAIAGKTQSKKVAYYNLDMILAIGYREYYIQNNFKKSKKTLNYLLKTV